MCSKYKDYDTNDDSSYIYVAVTLFVVCKLICMYIHTYTCMFGMGRWMDNESIIIIYKCIVLYITDL